MRRPLCYLCMAFVAAVFIMLKIRPIQEHVLPEGTEGSEVTWQGKVTAKEYKNESLILYLYKENGEGFLCYMEDNREPKLGSTIRVTGKAQNFKRASNPGGFDQGEYYRLQKIYCQMRHGRILAESQEYDIRREKLYQLRRRMERILEAYMNEKDASIMKAMLLGNKTELDRDSKQLYQKSGIAHVLAISGLHISILGMGFYELLRRIRCPRVVAACTAILFMLSYGQMVGMSSSAYRAIFMFAMKMGAELLHRTYDMLTALALAAVGILMEQPLYLYQAGFLLSFGAIIGIGCMLEVIKTDMTQVSFNNRTDTTIQYWGKKVRSKLQEGICGSLSIFTVHFPIMLMFYYEFPIYSFILNLLIIPAMGLVMVLGLVCVICGGMATIAGHGIAQSAAGGCQVLLFLFEKLCEYSLILPEALWITGRPENWRIIVFYVMMLLLWFLHRTKNMKAGRICMPMWLKMTWILASVIMLTGKTYGNLEVVMLDVGQGDGIWIETDNGSHYLIDAGSTSQNGFGEYTLIPFLKYMGTDVIDAVFLTHLDEDHISGIRELMEDSQGIRIRQLVVAQAVVRDETYEQLMELCHNSQIPVKYVQTGDRIQTGTVQMEVLHPIASYDAGDKNAASLVMKLEYGDFHALFTGDVGLDGEQRVREQLGKDWKCHLYKAAHHGSKYSNSQQLLEQLKPQVAVISCGENNSYGHPHTEVLERLEKTGSKVLRTDQGGAVMIKISKDGVRIRSYAEE